eukprot:5384697-Pyramimonas_sp.AAC.1
MRMMRMMMRMMMMRMMMMMMMLMIALVRFGTQRQIHSSARSSLPPGNKQARIVSEQPKRLSTLGNTHRPELHDLAG